MEHILKFLDDNHIEYELVPHERRLTALPPIPEVVEKGYLPLKNLLLTTNNKTEIYYMVCAPVVKQFKTNTFAKQIESSRLSFVNEEVLKTKLGVYPGIVSILNLINGDKSNVCVVLDESILSATKVCYPPNRDDLMLAFEPKEVLRLLEMLEIDVKIVNIEEQMA